MLRPTVCQSVYDGASHQHRLIDRPWGPRPGFYYCQAVAGLLMWDVTIAADPRQRSHSQVRVPRDSEPCFTVSHSRLPQPVGPDPRIYIPQGQGGPVVPPALWSTSIQKFIWVIFKNSVRTSQETLRLYDNDKPVNATWRNNCYLLWESVGKHKYTVWAKCRTLLC
jgi:hypothetical protein